MTLPSLTGSPVTVRVPATSANMGPGYDCLGMALDIWNTIEVRASSDETPSVTVQGEGAGELSPDVNNLVYRSMEALWLRVGIGPPPVQVRCNNQIPLKRGLGSSSAAIVGGLVAANHVAGSPLAQDDLLELATEIEGHPDNVTPALLGGMQLVANHLGKLVACPVPVPQSLSAVVLVPDVAIATEDARAVLPQQVSRSDAVFNMARTAALVNAMASSRPQDLAWATDDKLHQPYRLKLFPAMEAIFVGAMSGGALGVFLSGSGSTILALTQGNEQTVAGGMRSAAAQAGVSAYTMLTKPSQRGAHVV